MKTTALEKTRASTNNRSFPGKKGFTLIELLVSLSVLSLITLVLVNTGLTNRDSFSQNAYEYECDRILYTLLQHQNEAIMDGYRRQVRFLDDRMLVIWTRDGKPYRNEVMVTTLTFSGAYTGATELTLYEQGTVSVGGTVYLNGFNGQVKEIIVQPVNGRIYLNE